MPLASISRKPTISFNFGNAPATLWAAWPPEADGASCSGVARAAAMVLLQQRAPHVGEQLREIRGESRRRGAVDHAMVVGQRQRQDQAGCKLLAVPYRLHRRARD